MSGAQTTTVDSGAVTDMTTVKYETLNLESEEQTSVLFRLPPELRNRIYKYALYQSNIQLYPGFMADPRPGEKPQLSLLRTCCQIRYEASPFFYYINTFEFEFTFDIPRFVSTLTEQNREAVRTVKLRSQSIYSLVGGRGGLVAIQMLPALEQLHFRGHLCGEMWHELAMTRIRADGKSIEMFAD